MFKLLTKITMGILSLALISTASMGAEKVYTIKFAHVVTATTPKGKAADFFAKRVEELSAGQIKVQVFPSATLYDDDQVFTAMKLGNAQMAAPSFSKFTPIVPQFQIFDLPFIFRDTKHLHNVFDGEAGQKLKKIVDDKGFMALSYWDAGFKHFSSNKKPIIMPEDSKGQKLRVQSSKVLEEQTKVVGATPQIINFGEVYPALQQGVVDGTENPLSNFYNSKFYEVQTSLTLSDHGYLGYLVIIDPKFYKKLPKNLQENIIQAMNEATKFEREESAKDETILLAKLEDYSKKSGKLSITKLTPEQKKIWATAMEPVYPKFYDVIGKNLIDDIKNTK